MWFTLTLTFQGQSKSNLMVQLDFPYDFILPVAINSNIYAYGIYKTEPHIDFDFSKSRRVKSNSKVGHAIYDFSQLLAFNSNMV